MSKWVLIDVSWLAYRALHTVKGLSFEGTPTGVIFGFFQQLLDVCRDRRVASNQVALCFDSRQSLRKLAYPPYKEKRAKDRTPAEWAEIEVMQEQVKRLRRQILPDIGFRVLHQRGLESDDVMAQAVSQITDGVMITSDGDLYQSITAGVHWYDPARGIYYDPGTMFSAKGVGPNDWAFVKCLAGCDTDNVAGIDGVGEKTAIDFLWKNLRPGKRLSAIDSPEGRAVLRRNTKLITLPHDATQPVDLSPIEYEPGRFFVWAEQLGFASYLEGSRRKAWDDFFSGRLDGTRQTARLPGALR